MKFLLACAHTGDARSIADMREIMTCPVCDTRRKLLAVETREWHVHCSTCTFGRWCGQSKSMADIAGSRHSRVRVGHDIHVDYERYRKTQEAVREIFGRTVRNVIVSDHDFRMSHKYDPAGVAKLLPRQGELDEKDSGPECPF